MSRKLREILSTSLYFLVVLLAVYMVVTYVGQRTMVIGTSMEPMLNDGDNLIVDKLSYRFDDPQRYDIIVFPFRYAEKTYYIKRIIGLPGETIFIDEEGTIFINGEPIKEQYGKETIVDPGRAYEPITLGDDEYFVMGDNRNNSGDSRSAKYSTFDADYILGRCVFRLTPFSKIGVVK